MSYLRKHVRRGQTVNSAGGRAFAVDRWTRLHRFLVLGSEGGSYYATEQALTRENARVVEDCLAEDGLRTVAEIVRVSVEGRAPRNDAALFALAAAAGLGDPAARRAALDALPRVARIGTHLFQFAGYVEGFRGWGRSLRRAVGRWYAARSVDELSYQAVKYRQRAAFTHRDLLRLSHPGRAVGSGNPVLDVSAEHARLFEWIVRGTSADGLPAVVDGFVAAQEAATALDAARLVREHGLPREALRPEHLRSPEVWEALLAGMPMTALVRNLATMTRVGVLAPGSDGTRTVIDRLADADRLRRARVHPIAVLAALRAYAGGVSARGAGRWEPVQAVVDALDAAFYATFQNVEPAGTRLLLALDVSGSMAIGRVVGVPGLTPRVASAALALVTAATEPAYEIVGFTGGRDRLRSLRISPRRRLDDAVNTVSNLPFGRTDCALPMLHALKRGLAVDTFVIYTDSETWAGDVHPVDALRHYRSVTGIPARLVVVGMVANGFSIADPDDAGMLDVVGFDTGTPQLVSAFARGAL